MGFVGLGNDTRRVDQRGSRETEKNGVISGGRDSVKSYERDNIGIESEG